LPIEGKKGQLNAFSFKKNCVDVKKLAYRVREWLQNYGEEKRSGDKYYWTKIWV